jgi:WD40 repeat protein
MLTFDSVLVKAPLQLYTAGIIFSPTQSLFRKFFSSHISVDLEVRTRLLPEWSACIHPLEGHSRWVYTVVFLPDGSRVSSGSGDSTVRVWDVQTGRCQHTLKGHSDGVSSVVFSPDGSRMASGSGDSTVRVWDVQTGRCQHTLKGHSGWVSSVVFSPDGSRVASGSDNSTVRVWDVTNTEELLCYRSEIYPQTINFSGGSTKIMVSSASLLISSQKSFPRTKAGSLQSHSNISINTLGIKDDWVTLSSKKILWLPPEYRPKNWARYGDTIVVGSATGPVTFVRCIVMGFSSA